MTTTNKSNINIKVFEMIFGEYLNDDWYNRTEFEKSRYIDHFIAPIVNESAQEKKAREKGCPYCGTKLELDSSGFVIWGRHLDAECREEGEK